MNVALCLVAAILLSGCATDVANRYYATERFTPKDPKAVEILWRRPNREFDVIADFQSRGETAKSMQKRAARIGADAVIVSYMGGDYAFREQWAEPVRRGTYTRITGTAIKYK